MNNCLKKKPLKLTFVDAEICRCNKCSILKFGRCNYRFDFCYGNVIEVFTKKEFGKCKFIEYKLRKIVDYILLDFEFSNSLGFRCIVSKYYDYIKPKSPFFTGIYNKDNSK